MARAEIKTRRWKRVEYEQLIGSGVLRAGDPIELVGGELIGAEPQGSTHFAAIRAVEEALRTAAGRSARSWTVGRRPGQVGLVHRDTRNHTLRYRSSGY